MEPLQATLLAHLRQVTDFRKARGQRFAWDYLLALVAAAVAAGQTNIRNAILSLFRFHGWSNIAAATRRYAAHPQRTLQLLGIPAL